MSQANCSVNLISIKMKKTKFLLFSFLVLLCSCKKGDNYHKFYDNFKDNQWEASDKKGIRFYDNRRRKAL